MINISKKTKDTIVYSCVCGVVGKCLFKSLSEDGPSILEIRCPSCSSREVVNIGGDFVSEHEEDINYSLSIIIDNKIL